LLSVADDKKISCNEAANLDAVDVMNNNVNSLLEKQQFVEIQRLTRRQTKFGPTRHSFQHKKSHAACCCVHFVWSMSQHISENCILK